MTHWIMDYETLRNCFVAVFEHYKTSERKVFVIHDLQNDYDSFIKFLKENINKKQWHISFNGLGFDSQVTEFILRNDSFFENLSGCNIAELIYKKAQEVIDRTSNNEFSEYAPWDLSISQIDVFKLNHWDNPAKMSSLKWIQYSMDWENLQEMPIHHNTVIKTKEEIDTIVGYCINDVSSTKEVFNRSKSQIKLRKELTESFNINLYSSSEPKISKEIFAYFLSNNLKINKYELKKLRTYRDSIVLNDLILSYVKFSSPEFNKLLDKFKSLTLDPMKLKGSFKYSMTYKGVKTDFGLGGVHGARESGVYESDEDYVIITSDVTSFYPNLAIRNRWSPAHFPHKEFCDQYEWFFDERKKIPKKNPMNYVYKIILNSTYGLSNDQNSFFYDPELTMRITVNGQLSLMMLYEMIMERIPNSLALMQNTDGLETRIPRKYVDEYYAICEEWEEITNLQLEHDEYQKLVLADVNSYIALNNFKEVDITTWRELQKENPHYLYKVVNNKFYFAPCKLKGRFDFHELALHKNKSKLVVPKALYEYFIKGVLPEDYIKTNTNILDYCIGGRVKGNWTQISRGIIDGKLEEKELQKINRYYITDKKGIKIYKKNIDDGREIQMEAGQWMQKVFNKIELKPKFADYNINYKYYLKNIESEINNIILSNNQLNLF